MPYPVANPTFDGGATPSPAYTDNFIPQIWSGKLIEKFYASTVLAAIANTDYEGEIKNQGDQVKIRTKPTITIQDYEADGTLVVERPTSSIVELNIDKGKYFNTILDDVMETQADLNLLNMWADDASEQMKITIDTDVLGDLGAQILASPFAVTNAGLLAGSISGNINLGEAATPVTLTAADVIDYIVAHGQCLDEQNIPETGRWMILPAWVCAMIKRSELRDASLVGDTVSMSRNGRLGMIDRFTIYMSNLLPTAGGEWEVFAGHNHGLTFASQLTKVETLRGESTFGTYLRGLQVYGFKTVDASALTLGVITQ